MPQATRTMLEKLGAYKQLIDTDIDQFCGEWLQKTEHEYTVYSREVLSAFCAILQRGGKRLRGALVITAYQMLGGTDRKLALQAARIIELIHAYLLIVDDIGDRSLLRRGGPSAHIALTEAHREQQLKGSSKHFGTTQAMNAALLGQHLAQQQLGELPVDDTTKLEMLHDLNQILVMTYHGQINDLYHEALQYITEQQVRDTLIWKTAYYSFLAPLQLGAALAKADPSEQGVLNDYSMNIGLAFQIADDILGTFGNSFESGKSAQDDLKEGKMTLLVSRALQRANPEQKQYLLASLGNQSLTPADLEACKQIMEETGALDYAQQLANTHAAKAAAALDNAPATWSAEGVAFLRDLASYVTQRAS